MTQCKQIDLSNREFCRPHSPTQNSWREAMPLYCILRIDYCVGLGSAAVVFLWQKLRKANVPSCLRRRMSSNFGEIYPERENSNEGDLSFRFVLSNSGDRNTQKSQSSTTACSILVVTFWSQWRRILVTIFGNVLLLVSNSTPQKFFSTPATMSLWPQTPKFLKKHRGWRVAAHRSPSSSPIPSRCCTLVDTLWEFRWVAQIWNSICSSKSYLLLARSEAWECFENCFNNYYNDSHGAARRRVGIRTFSEKVNFERCNEIHENDYGGFLESGTQLSWARWNLIGVAFTFLRDCSPRPGRYRDAWNERVQRDTVGWQLARCFDVQLGLNLSSQFHSGISFIWNFPASSPRRV